MHLFSCCVLVDDQVLSNADTFSPVVLNGARPSHELADVAIITFYTEVWESLNQRFISLIYVRRGCLSPRILQKPRPSY